MNAQKNASAAAPENSRPVITSLQTGGCVPLNMKTALPPAIQKEKPRLSGAIVGLSLKISLQS
ncbi:MAG: hypothetical protein ACYDGO_04220 [Smithellaceae bacterium]